MLNYNEGRASLYAHWFRLIRAEHMAKLTNTTVDHWERVLPSLADRGYLDRITITREMPDDIYVAYQLGKEGRNLLARYYGVPKNDTRFKRKPIDDDWIRHAVATADEAVAICAAVKDAFAPQRVKTLETERGNVTPDYAFTLSMKGFKPLLVYLETDMGTEPIIRRKSYESQTSIAQKMEKYIALLDRTRREDRFRVLIVTNSRDRVFNMLGLLQNQFTGKGGEQYKNRFLFIDRPTLLKDALAMWANLGGEHIHLLGG
jgi:hypothetical protein